jgi:hypothetical protein
VEIEVLRLRSVEKEEKEERYPAVPRPCVVETMVAVEINPAV